MEEERSCGQHRENPAYVVECALDLGEAMLRTGAEILRVEDTIMRICTAYGGGIVDVFTILSLIILSWTTGEGKTYTQTRRIYSYSADLEKLEELNALSRHICADKPSCDEITEKVNAIMGVKMRGISKSRLAGYILSAAAFAMFFGGSFADGAAAAVVGVILYFWDYLFAEGNKNRVVYSLVASIVAGLACLLLVKIGIGRDADKVMIGSIMLLIPGVNLMNSLRDMMCGDIISGILRLAEALMISAAIAAGFGLAILLVGGLV